LLKNSKLKEISSQKNNPNAKKVTGNKPFCAIILTEFGLEEFLNEIFFITIHNIGFGFFGRADRLRGGLDL
jgi:hypothetical protein